MDYQIVEAFPHPLLLQDKGPCLSIYMKTSSLILHREKDQLVFKNLVNQALDTIKQYYPLRDYLPLQEGLEMMISHTHLWNTMKEGIAIFASLQEIIVYVCHKPFLERIVVANSFHLKPLVAYFQDKMMFTILALEADHFSVYLGSGYALEKVLLPDDIETTLEGLLGTQRTENYQTHGSYGGSMVGTNYHGHGGKKDDVEKDKEKFFRHVFKTMHELSLKLYPYPILVISTAVNHPIFTRVGFNPLIVKTMIDGSIEREETPSILAKIKVVQDALFQSSIELILNSYHQSVPLRVSSHLDDILKKMMTGNVETMLIEEEKMRPGTLDKDHHRSFPLPLDSIHVDDMLDDMLQEGYRHGVKVYVLPSAMMPSSSGIAAIFRYIE